MDDKAAVKGSFTSTKKNMKNDPAEVDSSRVSLRATVSASKQFAPRIFKHKMQRLRDGESIA